MSTPEHLAAAIEQTGPDGDPVRWRFKSLEWEVFAPEIDVGGRGSSPDGALVDLVKTATRLLEEYRAEGVKLHHSAQEHRDRLERAFEHLGEGES